MPSLPCSHKSESAKPFLTNSSPVGMSYFWQKRLSSRRKNTVGANLMSVGEGSLWRLRGLTEISLSRVRAEPRSLSGWGKVNPGQIIRPYPRPSRSLEVGSVHGRYRGGGDVVTSGCSKRVATSNTFWVRDCVSAWCCTRR